MKLAIERITTDGVRRSFEQIGEETVEHLAERLLTVNLDTPLFVPDYTARLEIRLIKEARKA